MKAKRFSTYPIAFLDPTEDRKSDERIRFFDGKSRESYFRSLEEAQVNLVLAFDKKGI